MSAITEKRVRPHPNSIMGKHVKRTKAWLALLLLLHAVVHPFLHHVPLRASAYGAPTFSAPVADKDPSGA